MIGRFIRFCFISCFIIGLIGIAVSLVFGIYYYIRLTRDLPKIERVSDYRPKAVTQIFSADGTLMAERYEERRYPISFKEVPKVLSDAFLAAEDADFYRHQGVDFKSIIRAMVVNLRAKKTRQGASTITQQVVKSLLLSREKTYERKAKEAILAYRLEKALKKYEIFSIYLNEIYLGSGAYGVKAAARVHFRKELDQLSIAEAAYLAGLPQKPTELSKPQNRQAAIRRQRYVLEQMRNHQMISAEEQQAALEEDLVIYPPEQQTIFEAPYYSGHVIKLLDDIFKEIEGYVTATNPGGYQVYTTADLNAHAMAERALQRALLELDKRQGWRGVLAEGEGEESKEDIEDGGYKFQSNEILKASVEKVDRQSMLVRIKVDGRDGILDLKKSKWAKRLRLKNKDGTYREEPFWIDLGRYLKPGHVIEVVLDEEREKKKKEETEPSFFILSQTPEVEGAFVVTNSLTGEVIVIIGGFDYKRSQFNRATQAMLQPGSAFKPFIYLTAIEQLNYTPATIVPDSPVSMVAGDGELWTPKNYDKKFLGPITLRTALQRSRNVVSVHLLEEEGIENAISTARRLGITTPLAPNMSLSLGTAEVKLIELVRAYGAFSTGGWLASPLIVTSIRDRDGSVVYEQRPKQKKVIDEDNAFLMANMMKGVVERGTARVVSQLNKPVAGKTGTTDDQMDAWFVGYTPEWVAGGWVGYDVKRTIGRFETGGKAAAPVFLYFMQEFLEDTPALDFDIPDGVIPVSIDPETGHLVDPDSHGAFVEYFKSGTEPRFTSQAVQLPKDYLSNDEF